ncbi:double-stranded RNA binding motif domain-containing protein [Kiloniella sp.]|uniref:double-stranded RNA binding motif domain-containing protein n=1 Tax=Kiloniella sp. TaxID=1938587 RepID=UPI003B0137AA
MEKKNAQYNESIPVPSIHQLDKKGNTVNPGSLLQEWCTHMELDYPVYNFLNPETNQAGTPVYIYDCILKNIERTEGQGRSKVQARKNAATLMLQKLAEISKF